MWILYSSLWSNLLSLSSIDIRFSSPFLFLGFGGFSPPVNKWLVFFLVSLLSLGGFLLIEFLVISPHFLIKFRRFFHQLNTWFLPQSPTRLRRFIPPKPWFQMFTRLLELASKMEGNYNVMKSHDQSNDRSNLIGTILYHNLSWGWHSFLSLDLLSKSTFQINLSNQLFESTYAINLLIELATPPAYRTSLSQINVCT